MTTQALVVFTLDQQRYGLPIEAVDQVVHAAQTTPLPNAPLIVIGVLNLHGLAIPVFNVRRRLGLAARAIMPSDSFIICHLSQQLVALAVDSVQGLIDYSEESFINAEDILSGIEPVQGVLKLSDGMIIVQNIRRFLSLDEEQQLQEALHEHIGK